MTQPRLTRSWTVLALIMLTSLLCATAPLAAAPAAQTDVAALQTAFSAAAQEFGVPEHVLLSVSYNVSRWEHHGGTPSVGGGYGLMHLTQADAAEQFDGKGEDIIRPNRPDVDDATLHTLDTAASLLGVSAEQLKQDPAQNIRGGAALLAQYAQATTGSTPGVDADWYGAVAQYSGSQEANVALDFADQVYTTINQGVERTTTDGKTVRLAARPVAPNTSTADPLNLRNSKHNGITECPNGVACEFIPAAYRPNSDSPGDYGNYDLADRPNDGLDVRYIVIHDTEISYDLTLRVFQNPRTYAATHYVVRAADGHVAQMVDTRNVAWHAGNWYVNGHAIGLEHEGVAIEGATWYSEQMYHASAKLVRYLAQQYNIPLDRAHIIGHDEIPGTIATNQAGMHWDPGPFWDWAHYMNLVGAPLNPSRGDKTGQIVTIKPNFATNQPAMTYCYDREVSSCRAVPAQPSNFVYLHTAPDANAPLVTNPYIKSDPTRANNWANKALTGQQFYRAGRQGDWDAIYFGSQQAWFYNPRNSNTVPGSGMLVTPKAGLTSIPIYGRAYPEAAAYPVGTRPQSIVPIYTIPAGQVYVASGKFQSDYYYAPTYAPELAGSDHVVVKGQTEYYQIWYNHRFAFVKASDVELVTAP